MIRAAAFLPSLVLLAAVPASPAGAPGALPPLVFVSRQPASGAPGQILGLGPAGRALVPGGRLMLRDAAGRVRPLLPAGAFHDVAHPSVSWDGRRIVFAAVSGAGAPWRLWVANADGSGLAPVTRTDRAVDLAPLGSAAERFARYDDFQPCWLPDGRIVFASTRYPQSDQLRGGPVSNLFVVRPDGSDLLRITSDRNGAESPSVDPRSGRVVYARWWFNRWRPSDTAPGGITSDPTRAVAGDPVSLWHAVSVAPDGEGAMLAGGLPGDRAQQAAAQPVVTRDGTLIAVTAERPELDPDPGPTGIVSYPRGFGAARRLSPPGARACAPAVLPDGRVLCSLDREGRGDFGLYVLGAGRPARVLDLPGTLELDAAVLAPRPRPPVMIAAHRENPAPLPPLAELQLRDMVNTFRFDCMNVFANAAVDEPFVAAPALQPGLRIRFFTTLARPAAAGGDTVVLLMEAPVSRWGGVHVDDLPADTPMFEQLVDARGRVVATGAGPAHGFGSNANRFGTGTKCVGCHLGHSVQPVPGNSEAATWVNAAPSATVSASSVSPGTAGVRAAVDRRARGPAERVGWIAAGDRGEWLRLAWSDAIELRALVLHGFARGAPDGVEAPACDLILLAGGREVRRLAAPRPAPGGTRVSFDPLAVDALEIRPRSPARGAGRGRRHGLAEVEAVGRLAVVEEAARW